MIKKSNILIILLFAVRIIVHGQSISFEKTDSLHINKKIDTVSYIVKNNSKDTIVYSLSLWKFKDHEWKLINENLFDNEMFKNLKFSISLKEKFMPNSNNVISYNIVDLLKNCEQNGMYCFKIFYRVYNNKANEEEITSPPFIVHLY